MLSLLEPRVLSNSCKFKVRALDRCSDIKVTFSEMSNPPVIPNSRITRYEKDLKARIRPRIHLENDVYLTNFKCYLVLNPFKISSLPYSTR